MTYLGVKYKSKDPEEVNATDIESDLSRYLSKGVYFITYDSLSLHSMSITKEPSRNRPYHKDHYTNYDEFIEAAKAAECEFKPLGEKLAGIESTLGKGYSIYRVLAGCSNAFFTVTYALKMSRLSSIPQGSTSTTKSLKYSS